MRTVKNSRALVLSRTSHWLAIVIYVRPIKISSSPTSSSFDLGLSCSGIIWFYNIVNDGLNYIGGLADHFPSISVPMHIMHPSGNDIALPELNLYNFEEDEYVGSKYVLTSPRSLEACDMLNVKVSSIHFFTDTVCIDMKMLWYPFHCVISLLYSRWSCFINHCQTSRMRWEKRAAASTMLIHCMMTTRRVGRVRLLYITVINFNTCEICSKRDWWDRFGN